MIRTIRTYSNAYLRRHRDTHAKHAGFGTHRHPYLLATVRQLADRCAQAAGTRPSLLDYGCGKGVFLEQMRGLNLFGDVAGYDPAVEQFQARPTRQFDIVICLDVLDQLEKQFVKAAIDDVAQYTARVALFDVITKQSPQFEYLRPRSALAWRELIEGSMHVTSTEIRTASQREIAMEGACPERAIILAEPR